MGSRRAIGSRWLIVGLWLLAIVCAAHAQEEHAPLATAQLVLADADDGAVPAAGTTSRALTPSGPALQGLLPYREHGSWIALQPLHVPEQPTLVVDTPVIDRVTLLLPDGSRLTRSKTAPLQAKGGSAVAMVFALPPTLKAGDTVWIHFDHRMRAPIGLLLESGEDWHAQEHRQLALASVVCALLLVCAGVAACYWAALREAMFGYYALHVLLMLGFGTASIGSLYAVPGLRAWGVFGVHGQWALGFWSIASLLCFARHFLSIERRAPSWQPLFDRTALGLALVGFGALASPWMLPWLGAASGVTALAVVALLIGVAAALARRGDRYGWYFMAGGSPLAITIGMRSLQALGLLLPYGLRHLYGIGAVCEALMLTVGLTDRVLGIRHARENARSAMAQAAQLELQNRTLKENMRLREEVERMGRHDLKTPLHTIVGVPQLLREAGTLNEEQQELLDMVERAGYQVLSMVNSSLDLLKMEQGTYRCEPQRVDLLRLLGRVQSDSAALAMERQVGLPLDPAAGAGVDAVFVRADEALCYAILANLLKNAIEAAPPRTQVTLDVVEDADIVRLRLHNQGAVPIEVRSRFFEKYTTFGKPQGTGFGTYSARLMARVQGGDLTMETSDAEGTALTLQLPAAGAAPSRSAVPRAAEPRVPATPTLPAPSGLSVMLVDDDEYNLIVLRRLLSSLPLTLLSAGDAREALATLERQPADVVFMDIEMPVMNGLEAVQALREQERRHGRPRALVVALSFHDDDETREAALSHGCDDYLRKPLQRQDLLRLIRQRLGAEVSGSLP